MTGDELAIRNLVERWHAATATGDVAAVLCLMEADVVFLVAGHGPMKGRDAFEQALRGLLASHGVEPSSEIQEIGVSGDLAYCWSQLTVCVTPKTGGVKATRSGSALTILRRQEDGSWLVFRDANLLSATK